MNEDFYRVDFNGNRVSWETCPCRGCILERAMRDMLGLVDKQYAPTGEQQRYYDQDQKMRHCRRWQASREEVISYFVKNGWFGCLMPMVVQLQEETREPTTLAHRADGPDVEPGALGDEEPPTDL